jgi:hypothetical protein
MRWRVSCVASSHDVLPVVVTAVGVQVATRLTSQTSRRGTCHGECARQHHSSAGLPQVAEGQHWGEHPCGDLPSWTTTRRDACLCRTTLRHTSSTL